MKERKERNKRNTYMVTQSVGSLWATTVAEGWANQGRTGCDEPCDGQSPQSHSWDLRVGKCFGSICKKWGEKTSLWYNHGYKYGRIQMIGITLQRKIYKFQYINKLIENVTISRVLAKICCLLNFSNGIMRTTKLGWSGQQNPSYQCEACDSGFVKILASSEFEQTIL